MPALNSKDPHVVGAHRILLAKTCIKCGKLRQGSEFKFFTTGGTLTRHAWCIYCSVEYCLVKTKRANHESWDKAVHAGESWSDKELDHLHMLYSVGYSRRVIAETLGRSIASVTVAYHKHFRRARIND